jgi:hypothetical protein
MATGWAQAWACEVASALESALVPNLESKWAEEKVRRWAPAVVTTKALEMDSTWVLPLVEAAAPP